MHIKTGFQHGTRTRHTTLQNKLFSMSSRCVLIICIMLSACMPCHALYMLCSKCCVANAVTVSHKQHHVGGLTPDGSVSIQASPTVHSMCRTHNETSHRAKLHVQLKYSSVETNASKDQLVCKHMVATKHCVCMQNRACNSRVKQCRYGTKPSL